MMGGGRRSFPQRPMSLFFSNALEGRFVGRLDVHEAASIRIALHKVPRRRLRLGAILDRAIAFAVSGWGIGCHHFPHQVVWHDGMQ